MQFFSAISLAVVMDELRLLSILLVKAVDQIAPPSQAEP
nr:hypothetical protein CDS [Bradyrhizobium sp.]